ncbi:MAG TPA: ABC transporter substrate-binding protein [Candidatus Binatia bacterium]|nr:ABC transporter substrate-binding protein [Candidatus Binatia bacterium]
MTLRARTIVAAIIALVASLAFHSRDSLSAERTMIGTPSHGLFEFPVVAALKKGYFRDEGLSADKVQMQPAIGVKALVSGDIDYLLAWGSTLRAAVTGVPLKVVAGMAARPLHVFIVRGDIKSGKELKGKIIGVDSFAGTVDYLARETVRHFGLDPDKDVKIIVSGESPLRLAAVRAGSIDATAIDVAFAVKAEEEGMRRLLNLSDITDLPLSGIGLTDKKLQTDREQVKKVVRATLRGTRFMKENRGDTIAMMVDYLRITPSQAGKAYDAAIASFTDDGYISDKGVLLDMQLTKERLKITKDIPLSQVVDWSVLKEIKAATK